MGKVQSKQGDCFVVNAHFNPVCQLDEITKTSAGTSQNVASKRSNIGLSEMSLSISRDSIIMNQKVGIREDKYPTKVSLPQVTIPSKVFKNSNHNIPEEDEDDHEARPEKAEEERSEKEEKQRLKSNEKISCDVSVGDLDKQEFSFTLYDFNGHGKVTKDDVAGLVRSIYDALGKSVKLPPSGSRTIKVHLAVSPDDPTCPATTNNTLECSYHPADLLSVDKPSPIKNETNNDISNMESTSEPSVHTLSTYITSTVEKLCNQPPECSYICQSFNNDFVANFPIESTTNKNPPNNSIPNTVKDFTKEINVDKSPYQRNRDIPNETLDPPVHHRHKHHHRHQYNFSTNRDHVAECRERRNHYLDLVGIENCASKQDAKHMCNSPYAVPRNIPPATTQSFDCPNCRILDRSHVQDAIPRVEPKKVVVGCERSQDHVSRFFKYHFYNHRDDDLLNFNFDLCDLMPDEKFDWEYYQRHKRSKSYDIYDKKLGNHLDSPKTKHKVFRHTQQLSRPDMGHVPTSPNHHYRHRHKEREHQRAMQQVANWIEKEHLGGIDPGLHNAQTVRDPSSLAKKDEHHHLHEHVHHHYHHYVDH